MMLALTVLAAAGLLASQDRDRPGQLRRDPSKPVPSKAETVAAWQKRQSEISSFSFVWTEEQTYPTGWLSNPRYPERERSAIPALFVDRSYVVAKTLAVEGDRMRYGFELDRKEEPDGVDVIAPRGGGNRGLGVRRHYSYVSVFDGRSGTTRVTSFLDHPPGTIVRTTANVDAQNLDSRAILMAFRPLDPVMGHRLIDRAITNLSRTFYRGKSIFLLEERHDPSGWKTILFIEPERDFLISRYIVEFEQRTIVDMDIDYVRDAQWGWVPNAWRITEMLADGSKRLVTVAKVSSYNINSPVRIEDER
ncbi:MAG TPA: hypothetical protein VEM94_04705 [Candidatus Dormibacteraeota bacterium]|nr:hypothetical protein [Candidatus Dormibacteraeota bacterium]